MNDSLTLAGSIVQNMQRYNLQACCIIGTEGHFFFPFRRMKKMKKVSANPPKIENASKLSSSIDKAA